MKLHKVKCNAINLGRCRAPVACKKYRDGIFIAGDRPGRRITFTCHIERMRDILGGDPVVL